MSKVRLKEKIQKLFPTEIEAMKRKELLAMAEKLQVQNVEHMDNRSLCREIALARCRAEFE